MSDPVWLSTDLILQIHDRQIREHGGSPGVRDAGLLDSALARARHLKAYGDREADMPALAAAYACGITGNHPFVDGNKRTAAVACELFLELNGFVLTAGDPDLYAAFIQLASSEMEEQEFAVWLRTHARPDRINEPAGEYG